VDDHAISPGQVDANATFKPNNQFN